MKRWNLNGDAQKLTKKMKKILDMRKFTIPYSQLPIFVVIFSNGENIDSQEKSIS